ncbi:MAG: AAA domain-containing protein [Desulfotalea sp.]
MRFSLRELVNTLFGRQSELAPKPTESIRHIVDMTPVATAKPSLLTDTQIISILNYWLDFELFDIPECPYDFKKGIVSEPADNFDTKWLNNEQPFPVVKTDSKMFVMFQCHRAGYLFANGESDGGKPLHPNTVTPRSYLLGVALMPTLNTDNSTGKKYLTWQFSEEDEDKVVNLATIRTIYRRCRSSVPENMKLKDWVDSCFESIDQLLNTHLSGEKDAKTGVLVPLTTEQLKQAIIEINRSIAREFWATRDSREFMEKYAKAVEVDTPDKYDEAINPSKIRSDLEDIATFRWRFCYYPDGNKQSQLGPFFASDLNNIIEKIKKTSAKGALSPALYRYLLGNEHQIMLGTAREDRNKYREMTKGFFSGRWPENPNYGLSLLQSCAVNLAANKLDNPVVAVNGPPGTGKTTLLKDVIADRFVTRTIELLKCESSENDWLGADKALQVMLDASIVVASSNNKAVENISKELPALAKVHKQYHADIGYFRSQAQNDEWGLFCAVLGNSSNRKAFCDNRLNKLLKYLKGLSNYLSLSPLVYQLKNKAQEEAQEILIEYFGNLHTSEKIPSFVHGINSCEKFLKVHMDFLAPFSINLEKIIKNEMPLEEFIEKWCQLDDERWGKSLDALLKLSQVWWKSGIWKDELESEYQNAKDVFNALLKSYSEAVDDLDLSRIENRGIYQCDMFSKASFGLQDEEDELNAEARIQQLSPIGSTDMNQLRSEIFITALRVNETMIKLNAAEHHDDFKSISQLINGKYQTHENTPNHEKLWGLLFLLFPVMSTSLSSVESQLRLMQKKATIGLVMFDEAGQSVNYHVVGLLQRSKQAMVVGDPIQLEPVVPVQGEIDRGIASDFIDVSNQDGQSFWGDRFLVSGSSAQLLADKAGPVKALIGQREVGLPLLVHRRCTEPMFSIANSIAYDNKMILATSSYEWKAISSGWFNVVERKESITRQRYNNHAEADAAFELVHYLVEHQSDMAKGGIYLITPFSHMKNELQNSWKSLYRQPLNKQWMEQAAQLGDKDGAKVSDFTKDNIGTVHTFQGKEASVVIFCLAASKVRGTTGGIKWVNSKPNLINVAVTRAKHHLFIVGNYDDWCHGACSSQLMGDGMTVYSDMDEIKANTPLLLDEHLMNTSIDRKSQFSSPNTDYSDVW